MGQKRPSFWPGKLLLFFILFLELTIITLGLIVYFSVFEVSAQIEYKNTPEIGPEIVISFNQPIISQIADNNIQLEPALRGRFIWADARRQLHFIPEEEMTAGINYQLELSNLRSFVFTNLKKAVFLFKPELVQFVVGKDGLERGVKDILPQNLPVAENTLFKKSDGQLVEINQAIIKEGKYIDIDLSKMILTNFENDQPKSNYEIAAIGSPWSRPTPKGSFRVLNKEENHFSGLARVWMPWSIRFYGGYYIHEVPYFPSGQRLTSDYSGGCIRLPIGAAEQVYNWAEINMPLIIH